MTHIPEVQVSIPIYDYIVTKYTPFLSTHNIQCFVYLLNAGRATERGIQSILATHKNIKRRQAVAGSWRQTEQMSRARITKKKELKQSCT